MQYHVKTLQGIRNFTREEAAAMTATDPDHATRGLFTAIDGDDFEQAGDLFRKVMDDTAREHLVGNIVAHLANAQERIQLRQCAVFFKADPEYGARVAKGLGLDPNEVEKFAKMSNEVRTGATKA